MASIALPPVGLEPLEAKIPVTHQIANKVVDDRHLGYLFETAGLRYTTLSKTDLTAIRDHVIEVLYPFARQLQGVGPANFERLINKLVGPGIEAGSDVNVIIEAKVPYAGITKIYYLATKVFKGNVLYDTLGWGSWCRGEDASRSTDPHASLPAMLYLDKSQLPSREKIASLIALTIAEL